MAFMRTVCAALWHYGHPKLPCDSVVDESLTAGSLHYSVSTATGGTALAKAAT